MGFQNLFQVLAIVRGSSENRANKGMSTPFVMWDYFAASEVNYAKAKVSIPLISLEKCQVCVFPVKRATGGGINEIRPLRSTSKL